MLLVFLFAPGGFSPGIQVLASSQKPTVTNSNSTRNGRQRAASQICYIKSLLLILLFAHADWLTRGLLAKRLDIRLRAAEEKKLRPKAGLFFRR